MPSYNVIIKYMVKKRMIKDDVNFMAESVYEVDIKTSSFNNASAEASKNLHDAHVGTGFTTVNYSVSVSRKF